MSEFTIIQHYFNRPLHNDSSIVLSIGDDCALLDLPADQQLAVTTDTLISGVHFPVDTCAADIAYKAVMVNLSDLAAMGAKPKWLSVALTLPEANSDWLHEFSESLSALLQTYQVTLIGGDITRGPLSITMTAQGCLPKGLALRRDGARIGDKIYVSGTLGDAGFALTPAGQQSAFAKQRLNRPTARVELGEALLRIANSAIDISDGLAQDLGHILKASGVGAKLDLSVLPLSHSLQALPVEQAYHLALTAGDDYELCFTIAAEQQQALTDITDVTITCIGEINDSRALTVLPDDYQALTQQGYQHF